VSENRFGLIIQAQQHVGAISLGPLSVIVRPKMTIGHLWRIVAFTHDLRDLLRPERVLLGAPEAEFGDLLVAELVSEAGRLRRAGLCRTYVQREKWLESPRGRINVVEVCRNLPLTEARLPCRYSELSTDTLPNRVILAGLRLGAAIALDRGIRSLAREEAGLWAEQCVPMVLTAGALANAARTRSRLTSNYAAAHGLVEFLFQGCGTEDVAVMRRVPVRGFLWNMATLFEQFVRRFLEEHLDHAEVEPQATLFHLYRAVPPTKRGAPRPRPDIIIRLHGRVTGVFDTKYRDLVHTELPPEHLYQLSVYALAFAGADGSAVPATILYPQVDSVAPPDEEFALTLGGGRGEARVRLRAVDWRHAAELLAHDQALKMRALAAQWASAVEHV
jgi:5-methylcytosine-specific restriction enzyme subunit McrC